MKAYQFIWQSLRYNALHHLPVVVGVALSTAVLIAALYVGDSVRAGLGNLAEARVGQVGAKVWTQGAPMRAQLSKALESEVGRTAAPVWHIRGVLASRDGAVEVSDVHLYGVTNSFWEIAGGTAPPRGVQRANGALAARFGALGRGLEELVFRGEPQGATPLDAPMAVAEGASTSLAVWATAYEGPGSRVGPPQEASEPLNLFVALGDLQESLNLGETVNEIWIARGQEASEDLLHRIDLGLIERLEPRDIGLRLEPGTAGVTLKSDAFLLPTAAGERAMGLPRGRAHLTWFVDTIRSGERSAPFSFVAAVTPEAGARVAALKPDEVLVNRWLADDLGLSVGDTIELEFHGAEDRGVGRPRGRGQARVAGVLEMRGLGADRSLTPPFPGIASAERCQDWDPGVPLDRARIREVDEQYWQRYGAAPKVILPLKTGQRLWSSRFGDLNEVQLTETNAEAAGQLLLSGIAPARLGIQVEPTTALAVGASEPATDFGMLFVGFAFLLVLAALVLTGMLFTLGLDRRRQEWVALHRLGLSPSLIRGLVQRESLFLSLLGALAAVWLAPWLTRWTIHGLHGAWSDAVAGVTVPVDTGLVSTALGGVVALVLVLYVQRRAISRALRFDTVEPDSRAVDRGRATHRLGALAMGLSAGVLTGSLLMTDVDAPVFVFFVAGGLFLAGALWAGAGLFRSNPGERTPAKGRVALALRGMQRHPKRSMGVISSLALTTFLVVGVGAHVPHPPSLSNPASGPTGGFEWLLETTSPIPADLGHAAGRARLGITPEDAEGITFWPVRVRDGDDASCLNPGTAQRPRILGLDSEGLSERGAFSFLSSQSEGRPWSALAEPTTGGILPVIADEATLRWGYGLGLGDTLEDVNDHGDPITLKIVGVVKRSFLQGALLADSRALAEHYPQTSPTRLALLDGPKASGAHLEEVIPGVLGDLGVELTTTHERLAMFRSVETSYVRIFLVIGLLGVLLGACAVAVLLARHALERRRELAVLRALGHSRRSLWAALNAEHFALVAAGLLLGATAAAMGVLPGLDATEQGPAMTAGALLALIALVALVMTSAVAWACVQGEPADVLSAESP